MPDGFRTGGPRAGSVVDAHDVHVRGLSWTPLGSPRPVLEGVDLRVAAGERVLLVGASGSGKSTLLRAIAGVLDALEPGEVVGEVLVGGQAARGGDGRVGLLLQDPADARVAGSVGRDVAFGPENLAVPREDIPNLVADALEAVGFPYGITHPTTALSGGEAQRLALAGVLALRPGVLLLDEPTSMLDADSARSVRGAVLRAQEATGATLIVVEHRLDGWAERVDRLVVLGEGGRVVADGPVRQVLGRRCEELAAAGVWVPGVPAPRPLELPGALCAPEIADLRGPLMSARDVEVVRAARRGLRVVRRDRGLVVALAGVSATIEAGSLHALRGASGAGKSTLLGVLAGLDAPTRGEVRPHPGLDGGQVTPHRWRSPQLARVVGWVPQRAEQAIVSTMTVLDCVLATPRALDRPEAAARERAHGLLEVLGLGQASGRNPYHLSGGELRRLAVATGLAHGPAVLALDEPTVGQDRQTWSAVTGAVLAARAGGAGVVAATHDDLLTDLADDVVRLRAGRRDEEATGAAGQPAAPEAGHAAALDTAAALDRTAPAARESSIDRGWSS